MLRSANYRELIGPCTKGEYYGPQSFLIASQLFGTICGNSWILITVVMGNLFGNWKCFRLYGPAGHRRLWERFFKGSL